MSVAARTSLTDYKVTELFCIERLFGQVFVAEGEKRLSEGHEALGQEGHESLGQEGHEAYSSELMMDNRQSLWKKSERKFEGMQ